MRRNKTTRIEQWFAEQSDDGDFIFSNRAAPYTVIGPSSMKGGRFVLATKPGPIAAAFQQSTDNLNIGLIGQYGLPCDSDVRWIRRVVKPYKVYFLGDLDPADLMIYSWFCDHLHPKRVRYLGISDSFLDRLGVQLPKPFVLRCSGSERRALPLLQEIFTDISETVGVRCARLVNQGKKVELDGVISALESARPVLEAIAGA